MNRSVHREAAERHLRRVSAQKAQALPGRCGCGGRVVAIRGGQHGWLWVDPMTGNPCTHMKGDSE